MRNIRLCDERDLAPMLAIVNDAAVAIYGRTREELTNQAIFSLLRAEDSGQGRHSRVLSESGRWVRGGTHYRRTAMPSGVSQTGPSPFPPGPWQGVQ